MKPVYWLLRHRAEEHRARTLILETMLEPTTKHTHNTSTKRHPHYGVAFGFLPDSPLLLPCSRSTVVAVSKNSCVVSELLLCYIHTRNHLENSWQTYTPRQNGSSSLMGSSEVCCCSLNEPLPRPPWNTRESFSSVGFATGEPFLSWNNHHAVLYVRNRKVAFLSCLVVSEIFQTVRLLSGRCVLDGHHPSSHWLFVGLGKSNPES